MITVRNVFQAKPGKAGELVNEFKTTFEKMDPDSPMGAPRIRLFTDLSGPFDTVVMEIEQESLSAWESVRQQLFSSREFQESFARTEDLLVSGHGQFFTLEAEYGR